MIRSNVRWNLLAAFALLAVPLYAQAQTGLRIYGALSNFDCYNDTGGDTEGFEIEIEGVHKQDVIHTWNYSAYGAPVVSDGGTPSAPSAIIRYSSSTAVVHNGGVTHFGVTLSTYTAPGTVLRRWLPKPTADIPNPPPVPYILPSHQSQVVIVNGAEAVHNSITNDTPDGVTSFWILPYGNKVHRQVELEELMPDNPIVQNAVPLGGGADHLKPSILAPGDTWTNDDPPGKEDTDSGITWYEVYEDVVTSVPHGKDIHKPGRLIGRIMDATITVISAATPDSLALSDTTVFGTQDVIGKVTIVGAAPLGGTVITLTSSDPSVIAPATVTIPANQYAANFTLHTQAVTKLTNVTITVSAGGVSLGSSLAIKPPDLYLLWLSFLSIGSGKSVPGTVYLTSPAPVGGTLVQLTSDSPVAKIPASVTVPAGATSVNFTVVTLWVIQPQLVTFTATYNGITKTTTLKVVPNFRPLPPPLNISSPGDQPAAPGGIPFHPHPRP